MNSAHSRASGNPERTRSPLSRGRAEWVKATSPPPRNRDALLLHQCGPFRHVGIDVAAELVRRLRLRFGGVSGELFLEVLRAHDRDHRRVELVDDLLRRVGRRQQAEPADQLVAGQPAFRHRRHVGEELRALRAGRRQRLELAGLDEGLHRGRRREHHVDAPAQKIGHRRAGAFVGHVQHLDMSVLLEQRAGEMRGGADARRSERQRLRFRLRQRDQIGDRVRLHVRIDDNQIRRRRDHRDRREKFVDVERPVRTKRRRGRHQRAGRRHQQRVAVGIGLGGGARADTARGAGLVLYHHRLAPLLGQPLRDDAAEHVGAAAGGKRHHHLDGAAGIVGGHGRHRAEAHGSQQAQRQHQAFEHFPSPFSRPIVVRPCANANDVAKAMPRQFFPPEWASMRGPWLRDPNKPNRARSRGSIW